jgi:hypothetical protein
MPAVLVPRPLRLSVAVLTALLFAAALFAWSAGSAQATVVTTMDSQSSAEIRAYWTPERMQEATPLDLPESAASPAPAAPTSASRPHGQVVQIHPTSGVSSFDFQPGSETSFPQSVHGKVFFTIPANDSHPTLFGTCSGTLVASLLKNVVFTAGHCVQDQGEQPSQNFMFVPGYRNGSEPFGEYPATTLLAPDEWTRDGDVSHDVAIAQLASPLELTLGARGIAFNKAPRTAYKVFGYPALPTPTYNGEFLIECDAPFFGLEEGITHPFSTVVFPCDMRQGSSGGGWVNPDGYLVSVVSHGYTDPSLNGQMAGPYFGEAVKRLYNQAGGSAECPPAKQAAKQAAKQVKKAKKLARHHSSRKAAKRLKKASRKSNKAKNKRDAVC